MSSERPGLLRASSTDWDKAWDVVSRLGAARKHLEHDTGATAVEPIVSPDRGSATEIVPKTRPLCRPLSVWILIGALWISIGMIVSAAIVTAAYLV